MGGAFLLSDGECLNCMLSMDMTQKSFTTRPQLGRWWSRVTVTVVS